MSERVFNRISQTELFADTALVIRQLLAELNLLRTPVEVAHD